LTVRIPIFATVAVAAIAWIAAGCGGGGTTTTTTTDSLSKAEFIKQADAICSKAGKQTQAEFVAFAERSGIGKGKEPNPSQYSEIATTILAPALKQQVKEIGALEPPEQDKDLITQFLGAVNQAIATVESEPQAARSPEKLLSDADKLIKGYGFKVCGQR
jgi:hypothetical protein